jgi:hypothetical protein
MRKFASRLGNWDFRSTSEIPQASGKYKRKLDKSRLIRAGGALAKLRWQAEGIAEVATGDGRSLVHRAEDPDDGMGDIVEHADGAAFRSPGEHQPPLALPGRS